MAPGFAEASPHGTQDSSITPAAVPHIGIVTGDFFEDTHRELLEAIIKQCDYVKRSLPGRKDLSTRRVHRHEKTAGRFGENHPVRYAGEYIS